jgi:hypothetical protein
MNNKKILVSFLLVFVIALSVAAVSAEDAADVAAVSADADDAVTVSEDATDAVSVSDDADVISDGAPYQPTENTVEAVQDAINKANQTGDTVDLSNYAEYDFGSGSVTISNDNVIFKGNGTTIIKGYGANNQGKGNALVMVSAKNVTIQ